MNLDGLGFIVAVSRIDQRAPKISRLDWPKAKRKAFFWSFNYIL